MILIVVGMGWLGYWQLRRAEAGNTLSWAYTFEWPLLAVFVVVFWVKTVRDEIYPSAPTSWAEEVGLPASAAVPGGSRRPGDAGEPGGEDQGDLAVYNDYLARLAAGEVRDHLSKYGNNLKRGKTR
jgi:hypothetical protein